MILLGFISLLFTTRKARIADICISEILGDSFLPCPKEEALEKDDSSIEETRMFSIHRKLMFIASHETSLRRSLAKNEVASGHCASKVELFSCIFISNGTIFLMKRKLNDLVLSYFDAEEVPLVSQDGLHQLHIFIFVLVVSHVLFCIVIMTLGWAKV